MKIRVTKVVEFEPADVIAMLAALALKQVGLTSDTGIATVTLAPDGSAEATVSEKPDAPKAADKVDVAPPQIPPVVPAPVQHDAPLPPAGGVPGFPSR